MNGLKNTGSGESEMARKTGKKGAQFQNRLAVKHGGYIQKFDGRTREARAVEQIQAELVSSLGGAENVSVQKILIIQRCSVKALKCALIESEILKSNGDTGEGLKENYLRWARELRCDLLALGLERQQKNVTDLKDYLEGNS